MTREEAYKVIENMDFKKLTDREHLAILTIVDLLNCETDKNGKV